MRRSIQFILVLFAVKLFDSCLPLSAMAAEGHSELSCAVALTSQKQNILIDLAKLRAEIEGELNQALAVSLKHAYRTKLEEARKAHIDLSALGLYSSKNIETLKQELEEKQRKLRDIEDSENSLFKWPRVDFSLPEGQYTKIQNVFWNRYAVAVNSKSQISGDLVVWDMQTAKILGTFDYRPAGGFAEAEVAVSADGKWAALSTKAYDLPTVLYDLTKQKEVFEFETKGRTEFSPDGSKIILDADDGVEVWDLSTNTPERLFAITGYGKAHFSQDSSKVYVVAGVDRRLDVWDVGTRLRRQILGTVASGHRAWSRDSRYFAMKTPQDAGIDLYDLNTEKHIHALEIPGIKSFEFSADSSLLVVRVGSIITLWDAKTGKPVLKLAAPEGSIRLSADKRFLAVATANGYIVYNTNDKTVRQQDESGKKASVEFTVIKNLTYLIVTSEAGVVTPTVLE